METAVFVSFVQVFQLLLVMVLLAGWVVLFRRRRKLALWIAGLIGALVVLALVAFGLLIVAYSGTNWSL